jgi:hypothetical protein
MCKLLLMVLLIEFGFSTSSVKADPVSPINTGSEIDKTNVKSISPSKGHGIPKDVPVGDFNTPSFKEIRQRLPIKSHMPVGDFDRSKSKHDGSILGLPAESKSIRGKLLIHGGVRGRLVPALPSKSKDDSSQTKMYKPHYHSKDFTPGTGDFGPSPAELKRTHSQ